MARRPIRPRRHGPSTKPVPRPAAEEPGARAAASPPPRRVPVSNGVHKVQRPTPTQAPSIEELDALIARRTDQVRFRLEDIAEAKRTRRSKLGGLRSGEVRALKSEALRAQIRAAHAELVEKGERGIGKQLRAKFGVSRSTIDRATMPHEPNE